MRSSSRVYLRENMGVVMTQETLAPCRHQSDWSFPHSNQGNVLVVNKGVVAARETEVLEVASELLERTATTVSVPFKNRPHKI